VAAEAVAPARGCSSILPIAPALAPPGHGALVFLVVVLAREPCGDVAHVLGDVAAQRAAGRRDEPREEPGIPVPAPAPVPVAAGRRRRNRLRSPALLMLADERLNLPDQFVGDEDPGIHFGGGFDLGRRVLV
jgi:hypothetical protein